MNKLPRYLKKYFWDVDFAKINPQESKIYVLRRLLEYGDDKAVAWMWAHYTKQEMKSALCNYRGYSPKSANFWALILHVNKENVKCLNRSFRETQKQFWPY